MECFEVSLRRISIALGAENLVKLHVLVQPAITLALGTIDSPKKAITMLATIANVLESGQHKIADNLEEFMNMYENLLNCS